MRYRGSKHVTRDSDALLVFGGGGVPPFSRHHIALFSLYFGLIIDYRDLDVRGCVARAPRRARGG